MSFDFFCSCGDSPTFAIGDAIFRGGNRFEIAPDRWAAHA